MARSVNGSTQYLTGASSPAPTALILTGDITAFFTVVTDTVAAGFATVMVCQDGGAGDTEAQNAVWYFGRSGANFVAFHEDGAGNNNTITNSAHTISTATLYRVAVIRDVTANSYQWVINGTVYSAVTTGYGADPTGGTTGEIAIGHNSAGGQVWDGTIEEVAITNRALTTAEARAYTLGYSPEIITDLVSHWRLRGRNSPEPDERGIESLTVVGSAPYAASAAMIYGFGPQPIHVAAAAGGATIPALSEIHLTGGFQPLAGGLG